MLARKVTKRLSVGGEVGYEYLKDTSGSTDRDYHNYGASVFSSSASPLAFMHTANTT